MWNLAAKNDRIALIDGDRKITYAELAQATEALQAHLTPRSLVFCLCSNTVGSMVGYFGLTDGGHVPLLLDAKISPTLLNDLNTNYRPAYFWAPADMRDNFPSYRLVYEAEGYCLLATDAEPWPLNPELCLLLSTSGSTGSPKLVRLTYHSLTVNTESIIQALEITPDDRAITSLPMNYVYGLSVVNTHIYVGATLVLTELNPYSKKFWDIVAAENVTTFAGVPFTYEMIDKLKILKLDLPSLQSMTQSGSKLAPELHLKLAHWAKDQGKKFIPMYGASEASGRMACMPPEYAIEKQGSIGIAVPGGRFELIDADGQVITEPDQVGELVYYGENVSLGYALTGADLIKPDENKGRLLTGDMAQRDADGFYYIVGRKKRFLKILGKRINLDDVERRLKQHFDTVDIACGGKDDELWIYVVDESLKNDAGDYVYNEFNINRKLLKVGVIPAIPKSNAQKILYSQLPPL